MVQGSKSVTTTYNLEKDLKKVSHRVMPYTKL